MKFHDLFAKDIIRLTLKNRNIVCPHEFIEHLLKSAPDVNKKESFCSYIEQQISHYENRRSGT